MDQQAPVVHSQEFKAFPADVIAARNAAQASKAKSIEHFPVKVNIPGINAPIAMPTDPNAARPPQQPQYRPAVNVIDPTQDPNNQFVQMLQQAPRVPDVPMQQPQIQPHMHQQQQPMTMGQFIPPSVPQQPQIQVQQPQGNAAQTMVQQYVNQVTSHNPGIVNPVADGLNTSVDLPSRFAYYGFTDLYVRPFVAKHLAKLQKANREQSLLAMVEAVSAVCYTTTPGFEQTPMAFELTLPDFFFVMHWLRLNSFTKSNYVHTTECKNERHLERVSYFKNAKEYEKQFADGELTEEEFTNIRTQALHPDSLTTSLLITNTTLKINMLDTIPDPSAYKFAGEDRIKFRPPSMRDVIEFAEAPEMLSEERSEFSFLAQLASHIQHVSGYLTLRQRINIVGECSGDQVALLKGFEKQLKDYGVEEKVRVTCKECGASSESKISLAAHSFFPFN